MTVMGILCQTTEQAARAESILLTRLAGSPHHSIARDENVLVGFARAAPDVSNACFSSVEQRLLARLRARER
jgi:hypothetical protein